MRSDSELANARTYWSAKVRASAPGSPAWKAARRKVADIDAARRAKAGDIVGRARDTQRACQLGTHRLDRAQDLHAECSAVIGALLELIGGGVLRRTDGNSDI